MSGYIVNIHKEEMDLIFSKIKLSLFTFLLGFIKNEWTGFQTLALG